MPSKENWEKHVRSSEKRGNIRVEANLEKKKKKKRHLPLKTLLSG